MNWPGAASASSAPEPAWRAPSIPAAAPLTWHHSPADPLLFCPQALYGSIKNEKLQWAM